VQLSSAVLFFLMIVAVWFVKWRKSFSYLSFRAIYVYFNRTHFVWLMQCMVSKFSMCFVHCESMDHR
jgi:hypothetical protein